MLHRFVGSSIQMLVCYLTFHATSKIIYALYVFFPYMVYAKLEFGSAIWNSLRASNAP